VSDPGGDTLATATDEELAALAAREGSDGVAFAALVEDLWVNPTASQVLAEQNRTRAVESFSVPQMVDRYETLYRSLLC